MPASPDEPDAIRKHEWQAFRRLSTPAHSKLSPIMTTDDPRIVRQVADQLGNYVYVLVDPRDSMPFYVDKGTGIRMLQHGIDAAQLSGPGDAGSSDTSRKIAHIRDIRATGAEPVIWVLRYGLGAEYTAVEAAAIDLLISFPVHPVTSPDDVRVPLAEPRQLTNDRREVSRGPPRRPARRPGRGKSAGRRVGARE